MSFLFHNYLFPASLFFGHAGAMVVFMLWDGGVIGISVGGFCLTYVWLEKRGIQTAVKDFVFRLESPAAPPGPVENGPQG